MKNQKKVCRLCLIICDNFKPIDGNTKDVLDALLPKINLFISEEPVICRSCAEVVKKCFDLKAKCLNTHNYIVSVISDKSNAKMHLKDVYLSKTQNTEIPENHNICRFCMSLVKNCFGISVDNEGGNMQLKMIETCLPELDLNIIEKPIICEPCCESLEDCFRFVTNYSIVENRIKEYRESLNITNEKCVIDLTSVIEFTLGNILTSKDDNTVNIVKEEKFSVDPESVDELVEDKNETFMEMEDHQKFNNVLFSSKNVLTCKEEDKKADIIKTEENIYAQTNDVAQKNENFLEMEDQKILRNEEIEIKIDEQDFNRVEDVAKPCSNISTHENNSPLLQHRNPSETLIYGCDYCSYLTKYERSLEKHSLIHNNPPGTIVYQCDSCSYQTKKKQNLKMHSLIHKDSSELTMYQCDSCSYQTKRKDTFKVHSLVHKDPSEVMIYQCDYCSYQTNRKHNLTQHMLVHKDPSKIIMHQCDSCSYQTKRKQNLKEHSLVHKDSSELMMYQCDSCSYQTKRKDTFKVHSLVHKDPSEVMIYQCDYCSYQTNRKHNLTQHMLVHKDPSKIIMHRCDSCSYQTNRKDSLKMHSLVHKDSSEITIYHCVSCSYQTNRKQNLSKHMLVHKDPSQIIMYCCDSCSFQTIRKDSLKRHSLVHKDASKITMYHCDFCSYRTRRKAGLKAHSSVHKDTSEITMYQCESCSFATKYKKSLQNHKVTHKTCEVTLPEDYFPNQTKQTEINVIL